MSLLNCVMVTKDRSPGRNYLLETLNSIGNSDFSGSYLYNLCVFDQSSHPFAYKAYRDSCIYVNKLSTTDTSLCETPNENVAKALAHAGSTAKEWVVFLEDDIQVGPRFFESTSLWLSDYAGEGEDSGPGSDSPIAPLVYPLASMHPNVLESLANNLSHARVPIRGFYGTQGFAIRPQHAVLLADYILKNKYLLNPQGSCWDLIMQKWALELRPKVDYFLTPAPSFLQHTGMESLISPREGVHTFPTFDPEYSYAEYMLSMELRRVAV